MKIIAVKKDENGTITDYKLDDGNIVSKDECISMVKDGQIENCNVGTDKTGSEFVRTDRDAEDGKHIRNLDSLPTFE